MAGATKVPKEESRKNKIYNLAIKSLVNEKSFLLEAGQGKNVNGNVFALLNCIRQDRNYDDFEVLLSLVPDKYEEWKVRSEKYDIRNVRIVEFGSPDYLKALGTSKYLITDNSFPAYFYKRSEQIYLNTWHGTPLKALGRKDIDNSISIANVQANMAKADYLLHPNQYTKDIMMQDYMMERVYKHKTVVMDYPRNDALYNVRFQDEIRERYIPKDKRAIAYMPTWRGVGRDIDIAEQIDNIRSIVSGIEKGLRENELLFVNLHFLFGKNIDFSEFDKVYAFPSEYETYDFLSACDVLITDYSSVSIDFAGTDRDIILYMYDYEEYEKEKGFYLDIKSLPFKKAYTEEELIAALHEEKPNESLDERFETHQKGHSAKRLLELLCNGNEEGLEIEDYGAEGEKPEVAFFENINISESLEEICRIEKDYKEKWNEAPVLMFQNAMNPDTVKTLKSIDENLDYVRISGHLYCSNDEFRKLWLYKKFGFFKKTAGEIYTREGMRQIGQFKYSRIEIKQGRKSDRREIMKTCNKGDYYAR